MTVKGLPEHAQLLKEITDLRHPRSLSDRSAAAEERNRQLMQEVPFAVTAVIMQRVRIEGVQALSGEEINNLMANQSSNTMETL